MPRADLDLNRRTSDQIYLILTLISAAMIVAAFIFNTPREIFQGFVVILTSSSNLLTDYFALSNPGATLFNVGVIALATLFVERKTKTILTGPMMAANLTIIGFSFFGKNLFNSIPIPLGVFLYSRLRQVSYQQVQLIGLFGTGLSPLVSEIAFGLGLQPGFSHILSYLIGIGAGMILTPISIVCLQFHQGFNLYNIGFTIGLIGMFITSLLRMFNLDVIPVNILATETHRGVLILLTGIFMSLIIFGLLRSVKEQPAGFAQLQADPGRLVSDFVVRYGLGNTCINMGLLGLATIWIIYLSGGIINGPIIGGMFTVVGFGAFGKNFRNTTPIVLGLLLAAWLHKEALASTQVLIAVLFGTTLAPVAGYYGPIAGLIAGYCHMAMVFNVGYLHGGLNLYNNGFSGGFVAATIVPILETIRAVRAEKRGAA